MKTPLFAAWAAAAGFGLAAAMHAAEPAVPQMCNGRSDANLVVNAHALEPKFILNLMTDAQGVPYGILILDRGPARLEVDVFCRLWQHLPGQPKEGKCDSGSPDGEIPEGATIVHAIGLGKLPDGTDIVVRIDARATDEGRFFRLRYKPRGGGHDHVEPAIANVTAGPAPEAADDSDHGDGGHTEPDGCDDGWTRVPLEGWLPLKGLKARSATS